MNEDQRLARERELLAAIVGESPDGIVVTDYPDMRVTYANAAFARNLGRERSELVGRSIGEVAAGALDATTIATLVEVARLGRPWLGEADRRLADGTVGRIQIRVTPRHTAAGTVEGYLVVARDVTALREAEGAARESEGRYQSIVDGAVEGIYRTSVAGRIVAANPALATILGYDSAEAAISEVVDVARQIWADADDRSRFLRLLDEQGTVRGYECQFVRRDGAPIWVSQTVTVVRGRDGKPQYYDGFVEDITERKAAEQALEASRALLGSIVDATPDVVFAKDLRGRYLLLNRGGQMLIGKSEAEVLGRDDTFLFAPDDAAIVMAADREVMRASALISVEETVTDAAGARRTLLSTKGPLRDASGTVVGVFGVAHDITDRNREARERERLAAVIEQSADGIVIVDREGLIAYANAAFANAAGRAASELMGRDAADEARTILDVTALADLVRAARAGQPWFGEVERRGPGGTLLRVEASVTPTRDASGDISGWIGVLRDVTERQRAHAALEASEARLRTALDTMLDGVSIQSAIRDGQGRIVDFRVDYANSAIGAIGATAGSLQAGRTLLELFPAHGTNGLFDAYVRVVETGDPFESGPFRYVDPDAAGGPLDQVLEHRAARLGDGYVLSVRDVTEHLLERESAQRHLERLNRVLRSLTLASQELVRAVDETALLRAFCSIIVEHGAYLGAWVGYREDDPAGGIRPVAWAGPMEGYLEGIALSWLDPERGSRGPAGTAIREGRAVVVRDVATDETLGWRPRMLERGFGSLVALPLKLGDAAFGTLVIYAGDPDSFGHDEIGLLEELANDLAYGVGTLRDRAAAARGEAERRRLSTAVEQSADAVVITDTTGAIEYVNPAFEQVSGYSSEEALGKDPRILKSGVQGPAFYAAMWAALASGNSFVGDLTNRRKDGSLFQEEAVISPIRDETGAITSYVAVKRDVTRERASEATRERQARERALITGTLAGLRVFPTPGATAEAICRQVVSLSGATSATISYFTLEGPAMPLAFVRADGAPVPLRRLPFQRSRRLRERGEEGPWVEAWVHRPWHPYARQQREIGTRALAYAPIRHGGTLIGILMVTSAEPDAVAQLTESLPALLEFAGFAGALVGPAIANLTADHQVHERIADVVRTTAFRPVFQPIVELASGLPAGYEALTRFTSGIAPNLVFADARAVGLEAELELATLEAAISAAAGLPPGPWLSLNVSPGLVTGTPSLARLLRKADRPLVLEVTEHVAVADYAALRAAIGRLRPRVRVAVDDAGSGVANFGHIVELRAAFVKLDMALVRGIDSDLTRQALVVGLLHFARESNSQTIAEGVETEAELATLSSLGVPFAQGYLLGRPSPVEAATPPTRPG